MFSGIIKETGVITSISNLGTNKTFTIQSPLSHHLSIDQSIAHNGVCLTVERIDNDVYQITAIEETLLKTTLNNWKVGQTVNLETSMSLQALIDGHLVQGHVDATAKLTEKINKDGSWELTFQYPEKFSTLIVEKGSITIDGISLTVFECLRDTFKVAIIPYTWNNTNIHQVNLNDFCNIEFDIVGKYLARHLEVQSWKKSANR